MDVMLGVLPFLLPFLFFVGRDAELRDAREREIKSMSKLRESLEDFIDKSNDLKKELNDMSDQIREVEHTLREQKINFEFERMFPGASFCSLKWALRDGNNNFRLYYVWPGKEGKANYKPFIECPIEIRRKYVSELPLFVEAFGDYIAERKAL